MFCTLPDPLVCKNEALFSCPRSTLLLCPLCAHLIILVAVHPWNRHYTVKLSQCSFPLNNRDSLATMRQSIMTITTARAHQRIMGDYYLWSAPKQNGHRVGGGWGVLGTRQVYSICSSTFFSTLLLREVCCFLKQRRQRERNSDKRKGKTTKTSSQSVESEAGCNVQSCFIKSYLLFVGCCSRSRVQSLS